MDPITFALGLMVLVGAFKVGVKATADGYATMKAAGSGKFDFIDADRQRRADTRQKLAAAWAERRKLRAKQAGDDSGTYRPGVKEYASDLYHGFWEDRLDHRSKKRAGRPEWQYDPDAKPWHVRFDEAVIAKGKELRGSRAAKVAQDAARRFVAPVGEKPADDSDGPYFGDDPKDLEGFECWWCQDVGVVNDRPCSQCQPQPLRYYDSSATRPKVGTREEGMEWTGEVWTAICPRCDRPMAGRDDQGWLICDDCGLRAADRNEVAEPVTNTEPTEPESDGGTDMTAPTDSAAVAGEMNNNEDARRVFEAQIAAAAEASELLAVYEQAQRRLDAVATSGLDGINSRRFDVQAQAAQANAADLLPASDMSQAAQAIEGIRASAEAGLAALDKYRDSEQLVNDNNVDGQTLETAGSV